MFSTHELGIKCKLIAHLNLANPDAKDWKSLAKRYLGIDAVSIANHSKAEKGGSLCFP